MVAITEAVASEAKGKLQEDCRIMKARLDGLLDSKGRVAEEVHAIRKLGKSLRGGFHLFLMGKTAAREIQAIGRMLSAPRDAVSRLSTWRKLQWQEDAGLASAIEGLLEIEVQSAARRPNSGAVHWCKARVDSALMFLEGLPEEILVARMEEGVLKLKKTLGKRSRRLSHHAEEDFHEARKAVKAWLGAVKLMPDGVLEDSKHWSKLADVLGDENDLATLSGWLISHGFTEYFAPELWDAIANRRMDLQKQAISMVVDI